MKTCTKCNTSDSNYDFFCRICGSPLEAKVMVKCVNCDSELIEGQKYCQKCGASTATQPA